jgi:hypothetical protein
MFSVNRLLFTPILVLSTFGDEVLKSADIIFNFDSFELDKEEA